METANSVELKVTTYKKAKVEVGTLESNQNSVAILSMIEYF